MDISDQSITQLNWPKERVSTDLLCPKCGDRFQLDLPELKFNEILHGVRSGYSPDDVECTFYSKQVAHAQKGFNRCQSELGRLEDLSNAIKEQQKLLLMYMAGIRSIMSPIRKLPQEILVEVFKYVCCNNIGANCILSDNRKRLPTLTLSRVCIQWYNLVTSTPVLWSSFGTEDLDSSHNPFLFRVFIERSHLHAIDFGVNDYKSLAGAYKNISELPSDPLACVAASVNRWRRVNLRASESFVQAMLQPLITHKQNLPALVSLSIESEITELIPVPVSCPNLQSLTLKAVALEFGLPLPAVTHLNLHQLSAEEASRLIACCPNVQDITLKCFYPVGIASPPISFPLPAVTHLNLGGLTVEEAFRLIACCPNVQNITLNSLSLESISSPTMSCVAWRLAIKCGMFPSVIEFLCNMTFPQLVHLVLSDWESFSTNCNTRDVKNLCPMFERSHQHLTHLSLHGITFPPDQWLGFFRCVPTVAVLDFDETLSQNTGVYLVLKALIAPLQKNELEALDEDRDDDELTLDSEDQFREDGDESKSDDDEDEDDSNGDDSEDEEKLDMCDKAENFEVPEGLCLLPRLKELNLGIRPRNELLLQLVRSRWRPSSLLVSSNDSDDNGSGACVCLQTLCVKHPAVPGIQALGRLRELEKSLYCFNKVGMVVKVHCLSSDYGDGLDYWN